MITLSSSTESKYRIVESSSFELRITMESARNLFSSMFKQHLKKSNRILLILCQSGNENPKSSEIIKKKEIPLQSSHSISGLGSFKKDKPASCWLALLVNLIQR